MKLVCEGTRGSKELLMGFEGETVTDWPLFDWDQLKLKSILADLFCITDKQSEKSIFDFDMQALNVTLRYNQLST
jgi:hypothetical protein